MLAKKIAYNTIVAIAARAIGLALALVILGFITRYLGASGFGDYTTILAFLYIFSVLSDFGLYSICVREISVPLADEKRIIGNIFTIKFFGGLFCFILAPLIGLFSPYSLNVKIGILIGAVGFWFLSNSQVLMGIFQKHLRIDKVSLAEISGRLTQFILVSFFIWKDFGFLSIVCALVFGALVNFILVFYFARKYIKFGFCFDFLYWRYLIKEAFPLGISAVLTMIYFKLDAIMLSVMKSSFDVGIYGLSYKILESLLFFPAMFVGLIMPLMSKYAVSSIEKFKYVTQRTFNMLLMIIVPMIIGTIFLSKKIVVLIGGEDFILSSKVLDILIVATGIIFLGVLFSNEIISLKKQKFLAYIYGIGAVFNVVGNLIFIPKYSFYAAATTTVLTELLVTILMLIVIYKSIKNLPNFSCGLKCLIGAAFMALFLFVFSSLNLFVLIIIGGAIYVFAIYLLKVFSMKEIKELIG